MGIAGEILARTPMNISFHILLNRPRHALFVVIGGVDTILVHMLKQQALHMDVLLF